MDKYKFKYIVTYGNINCPKKKELKGITLAEIIRKINTIEKKDQVFLIQKVLELQSDRNLSIGYEPADLIKN